MVFQIIIFSFGNLVDPSDLIGDRSYGEVSVMEMKRMFILLQLNLTLSANRRPSLQITPRRRRAPPAAAAASPEIVPAYFFEENPFVQNSSVLLVQADEGVSVLVMDRIGDIYRSLPRRADVIVTTVGARHKCQQGSGFEPPMYVNNCYWIFRIDRLPAFILCSSAALPGGGSGSPTLHDSTLMGQS
ncbi:hypothetical protein F511_08709 [Dorcoceras hygrometricum]|uniref:Uncharacterized protein n=1 Tax=Dorcoceras hygrometricum TaxID=472368 RepID=A0A2Z7BXC5_9LAMI|nr:hypothetical protein F511_08709 [Dorcoceras hygrometricum]